MKIRVYDSDGVFRGGLFDFGGYSRLSFRTWNAPPHPHYREYLIDHSGHGAPSDEGSWLLLQVSRHPEEGPPDDSDSFDAASQAIRVTVLEALRWFEDKVYQPPIDLIRLAARFDPEEAEAARVPAEQTGPDPMTDAQREVWEALEGRAKAAKELAADLLGSYTKEDTIRKRIQSIKATGRTIDSRRGLGYYRPDAPPPELQNPERESG